MSSAYRFFTIFNKIKTAPEAHAHCDIPCGIYDPHLAQLAAHTVIRMVSLIHELPRLTPDISPQERLEIVHNLARYTATKDEHAELCKKEIRILWGDYFKPEHVQQFPELHDLVWKVMKLGSKSRQHVSLEDAHDLLATVQKIAEIFWKTKGYQTVNVKAPYPSGGELVVPKL
ncbi:MAG: superoxide dismutase, Ni [Candidatus Aenigmarchaeota archaeon]|nr:superoxide dismutase, Ni [Candidatus Aenigmarchaeota archaeon]